MRSFEGVWDRFSRYLMSPCDGSSLALFRICFSILLIFHWYGMTGQLTSLYQTAYHFGYFENLPIWTVAQAKAALTFMAFCSAVFGLGIYYRAAAVCLLLGSVYTLIIDKAYYSNEAYLICLITFLLACAPAQRVWALEPSDVKSVPRWSILVIKCQIVLVYLWSAVSMLHSEWMYGYPQIVWISRNLQTPFLGAFLNHTWSMAFVTYGAIVADLAVGLLLSWRPTFWLGALTAVVMHTMNFHALRMSIYPWTRLAVLPLFYDPDCPRRVVDKLRSLVSFGGTSKTANDNERNETSPVNDDDPLVEAVLAAAAGGSRSQTALDGFAPYLFCFYLIIQLVTPARQFLIAQNLSWSEFGNRFSWSLATNEKRVSKFEVVQTPAERSSVEQMDDGSTDETTRMLDTKSESALAHELRAGSGVSERAGNSAESTVSKRNENGAELTVSKLNEHGARSGLVDLRSKLMNYQQYQAVTQCPDVAVQFAHMLADKAEHESGVRPTIRITAREQLNRHEEQDLIDSRVDLAKQPLNIWEAPYIVPLKPYSVLPKDTNDQ